LAEVGDLVLVLGEPAALQKRCGLGGSPKERGKWWQNELKYVNDINNGHAAESGSPTPSRPKRIDSARVAEQAAVTGAMGRTAHSSSNDGERVNLLYAKA